MGRHARADRPDGAVCADRRGLLRGPRGGDRRPGDAALRGRQLLRQRQADRRGRRPAAVRRRARVRHERQGRLAVEPDPLGQPAHDQGDVRPADRLPLPVPGHRPGQRRHATNGRARRRLPPSRCARRRPRGASRARAPSSGRRRSSRASRVRPPPFSSSSTPSTQRPDSTSCVVADSSAATCEIGATTPRGAEERHLHLVAAVGLPLAADQVHRDRLVGLDDDRPRAALIERRPAARPSAGPAAARSSSARRVFEEPQPAAAAVRATRTRSLRTGASVVYAPPVRCSWA